jgi:adenosine deaminase
MPKAEIHVHLEGATDAATIWELAQRNGVSLPARSPEEWQRLSEFRDFDHFIEIYLLATQCMQTPQDFAFMVERFIQKQAEHNVRYCETFLSASQIVGKFPPDEFFAALSEAARTGEASHGVRVSFIPDISRHEPETARPVLEFTLQGKEQGLFIGLGLGGKEVGYPPEMYTDIFTEARRQGLHVVAHAGETESPASVWGALRSLQVERIGHGVRAVEDPQLVEHLARTQTPLEVCPCSNYRLKVVPADQPHPIRALLDHGVYVTVNSDDPAMFSTDLTNEYALLAGQGFTWDELWQLNLNTLESTFLSDDEKGKYRQQWQAFHSQK